jgi:hypothetical protein
MLDTITSKTSLLLDRLNHVKATGQGKWLARCPAHDDRSPSLSIRETGDRVLVHCFAGCAVSDVLLALGLGMADLFPERLTTNSSSKPKAPKFSAYELFQLLVQEAVILALALEDLFTGKVLSDSDLQRAQQAYQCIMRLHTEVSR